MRYNREVTHQLLDDALNVYVAYARRLKWNEYFRLVRKLLYKIEKAKRRASELSSEKGDA